MPNTNEGILDYTLAHNYIDGLKYNDIEDSVFTEAITRTSEFGIEYTEICRQSCPYCKLKELIYKSTWADKVCKNCALRGGSKESYKCEMYYCIYPKVLK